MSDLARISMINLIWILGQYNPHYSILNYTAWVPYTMANYCLVISGPNKRYKDLLFFYGIE